MGKKKLVGIIAGCVIIIAAMATPLGYKPVTDYSTLTDYLYDTGESIMESGMTMLAATPYRRQTVVSINERYIYVSEYPNAQAMMKTEPEPEVFMARVGKHDTVYFYRAGRIQVMYIVDYSEDEDDRIVIRLLEDALGKPCKVM